MIYICPLQCLQDFVTRGYVVSGHLLKGLIR